MVAGWRTRSQTNTICNLNNVLLRSVVVRWACVVFLASTMVVIIPYLSSVVMSIIAMAALLCGSMMSWQVKQLNLLPSSTANTEQQNASPSRSAEQQTTLSMSGAVMMPIVASVVLFSLFVFFSNVQLILLGYFFLACLTTCSTCLPARHEMSCLSSVPCSFRIEAAHRKQHF